MRLLVVEDDPDVAQMLLDVLRSWSHVVDHVDRGEDALWLATEHRFDVVLLDVGLPDLPGTEVVRRLRADGIGTPVLMLTGRQEVEARVAGLDAGADDYLSKPFALPELAARLRALGRRAEREVVEHLVAGDVVVDPGARTVVRAGVPVPLAGREYALVELLARSAGRVVSRSAIAEALWDLGSEVSDNALDVLVSAVRSKLDRPFPTVALQTVRGSGYRLG